MLQIKFPHHIRDDGVGQLLGPGQIIYGHVLAGHQLRRHAAHHINVEIAVPVDPVCCVDNVNREIERKRGRKR